MPYCYRYTLHEKVEHQHLWISCNQIDRIKKHFYKMEIVCVVEFPLQYTSRGWNWVYVLCLFGFWVRVCASSSNWIRVPNLGSLFCLFISLSQPFRLCVIPLILPCAAVCSINSIATVFHSPNPFQVTAEQPIIMHAYMLVDWHYNEAREGDRTTSMWCAVLFLIFF